MEEKDLDKIFREAFNEAEETPSSKVWTNIKEGILMKEEPTILPSKRRIYWPYAAAAVLLITIGGYWAISVNTKKEFLNASSETTVPHPKTEIQVEESPQKEIGISPNHYDRKMPEKENTKTIVKKKVNENKNTIEPQRELIQLEKLPESKLALISLELENKNDKLPSVRQVTEIDDIKPLIEFDDEPESMLASSDKNENKNIISTVLNKISENLDSPNNKGIRFVVDEEGSFGINIINSIAKNRNKKRK